MSSQKLPLSVFIVTKNEAQYILDVIESVYFADDIVVVDSGSSDNTVQLAESAGARVIFNEWPGFAKQKNFAMNQCKHDWMLNLDGDEVLPPNVANSIKKVIDSNEKAVYRLHFEDVFWSKKMSPKSGKRSIVRLFKKDLAQYPLDRKVHENLVVSKGIPQKSLPGLVTHYGYESTEILMMKQNKYSSLKAMEKFEKGKKPSLLKLTFIFPLTFVKAFFFKRMFLSGKRGFVHATIDAMYSFLKEAKLFELYYRSKD